MTEPVLGIDLGTTNSVMAVAAADGVRTIGVEAPDGNRYALMPSVVSFHPDQRVLVGHAARERRMVDASNTIYSVKRLIGRPFASPEVQAAATRFGFQLAPSESGGVEVLARGERHSLEEIGGFILSELRVQAERELGTAVRKAVITVPASFNELQRAATKAAGRIAGLDVLRILNEPTAAALAYGYGMGTRERVLVYDFGGGTFDATVLELAGNVFEVSATLGDTRLGGDDIDHLIAERMADEFLRTTRYDVREDRYGMERLRVAAEWVKCQLSAREEITVRVEDLAYGANGAGLHLDFRMYRTELEHLMMPLVTRTIDVCDEVLRLAAVGQAQLDQLILVGGSSRNPLVVRMVEEFFGRSSLRMIDPDVVVAHGAAIQGRALASARGAVQSVGGRDAVAKKGPTLRSAPPPPHAAEEPPTTPIGVPQAIENLPPPPPQRAKTTPPSVRPPPPLPPASRASVRPGTAAVLPRPSPSSAGFPTTLPQAAIPETTTLGYPAPLLRGQAPVSSPDKTAHGYPAPLKPSSVPPASGRDLIPLLVDVTPLTLGVETVEGICEPIIPRNAPVPTEQRRMFTTGHDNQQYVSFRVAQGESRRLSENQLLGEVRLLGLPARKRGETNIEVTFHLDADGTLDVKAVDQATGKATEVRLQLIGGISEEALSNMRARVQRRV